MLLGDRLEIELLQESSEVLFQVFSEARRGAELLCPKALGHREH
ncbi:MAG: hypothetical protein WBM08_01980 [Prochlorococcaceae cyanobacterium]